jgi:cysteine desulfurase
MLHALEGHDIYVSTQTACSTGNYSKAVYAVVKDEERAGKSLRISLSYLTTKEELDKFINVFKQLIEELHIK